MAPWRARRPRTRPRGPEARLSPPWRRRRNQTAIAADAEDRGDHRVALHDPFEGARPLEVEAVDELAFVGSGVGPGAGREGSGEDRQLPERDQAAHRPDPEAIARRPPLTRFVAGAPGEREGRVEQQHREDEVAGDQPRREVVLDDEGAEDRLADDAERQHRPEQGQVPAERAPEPGEDAGGDHREADEPGQDPVRVLDHRVGVERGDGAAVAFRPVRAAEPGAGQPHRRAGQHDQRQRRQRDRRHPGVELRGDVQTLAHRPQIMPHPATALLLAAAFFRSRRDQVFDQVLHFVGFDRGSEFGRHHVGGEALDDGRIRVDDRFFDLRRGLAGQVFVEVGPDRPARFGGGQGVAAATAVGGEDLRSGAPGGCRAAPRRAPRPSGRRRRRRRRGPVR